MTEKEFAEKCAEKLIMARDGNQAAIEIATNISSLTWALPGSPPLTYAEKLALVELIRGAVPGQSVREMVRLGTDNSRTLELIKAIGQLVK